MAEDMVFPCKICNRGYTLNFYSLNELANHLALHSLVSSGKAIKPFATFLCSECHETGKISAFYSYSCALAHLKIHDEIRMHLKTPVLGLTYEIIHSQIFCGGCQALNERMFMTTNGEHHITEKHCFNSVSEFFQHFLSEHMKSAPKVVKYAWTRKVDGRTERLRMKQCSFCGVMSPTYESRYGISQSSWWEEHKRDCDCLASFNEIKKELVAKEAISAFLSCYKLANVPDSINSQSLLSSIDNRIVRKIVKRML